MIEREKLLIDELQENGLNYPDINFLLNTKHELPPEAVKIILKWLPLIYDESVGLGDGLVRSLISAQEEFDPTLLIQLYEEREYNNSIKFGICYTLALAKTFDISNWMKEILMSHPETFGSGGLLHGLTTKANFKTSSEMLDFLKQIFDRYCDYEQFFKLFGKYGTKDDIPFLESKVEGANKTLVAYIEKTKGKILNRKNNPKFPKTCLVKINSTQQTAL
jgi:hypothetical protein